ncbi:hypothetical protein LTR37_002079 [Vermiconidia calcicola]|uniref:Uncharacterized protein n=1 Tax=Vermiconidia calcicola TaxID=1690605 RepID=A0ACC3NTK7_9PEZI|nr:hypothetical protein LTR37_002079 [Vermiconidia calcicola]
MPGTQQQQLPIRIFYRGQLFEVPSICNCGDNGCSTPEIIPLRRGHPSVKGTIFPHGTTVQDVLNAGGSIADQPSVNPALPKHKAPAKSAPAIEVRTEKSKEKLSTREKIQEVVKIKDEAQALQDRVGDFAKYRAQPGQDLANKTFNNAQHHISYLHKLGGRFHSELVIIRDTSKVIHERFAKLQAEYKVETDERLCLNIRETRLYVNAACSAAERA